MTVIEKYPTYIFVLTNVSVLVWWALLTHGRFPGKLSLLVLLLSLAGMNFTLLITKYVVKRRRKSP
jgi:hypothetical protein